LSFFKTIFFNFKYLPFLDAIKFPIVISPNVYLLKTDGTITINFPIKTYSIKIGFGDVGIFDKRRSRTIWEVSGRVVFNGQARIGIGSKISVGLSGELIFGDNFQMSSESSIVSYKKISFGSNCILSWDILIIDTDFHNILSKDNFILNKPAEIIIGNNVWIGYRTVINKGSFIASNSVVSACSRVFCRFNIENSIIGGNPAKVLLNGIHWEP
jgi:acetyltransferase-like isoleucine patch superfamily enzyme